MKKGVIVYAHNNRTVDYALLAIISGGLAKKHLNVPVTLVTDDTTYAWMKQSNIDSLAENLFEHILKVEKPETTNLRNLYDGPNCTSIPFVNSNRNTVWDITPYDKTLLIDSDFLIQSNNLQKYWDIDQDVLLGESINDIYNSQRLGYLDNWVSETSIKLKWATTVMFTKNQQSKLFFDTVEYIKHRYKHFADIFRFDDRQYRNDISFSIAQHILNGFQYKSINLPPVLTTLDRDILYTVQNNKLTFLIDKMLDSNYCAAYTHELDVHVMNKQSICRNKDELLNLI